MKAKKYTEEQIIAVLKEGEAGAIGYLLKNVSAEELAKAIRAASAVRYPFTRSNSSLYQ